METTKKLAKNITILRMYRGLSQENMAFMLNITRKTYSQIESGNKRPDYETFIQISKIFKVSISCLESFDMEFHIQLQSLFCNYYSNNLPKEKILKAISNRLEENFSNL